MASGGKTSGLRNGIQKVETFIFVIFGPNWSILNEFGRNSSFTKSLDLSIAPGRSGTCFSSCLASSTYFSIRKLFPFDMVFHVIVCVCSHRFHSLKSVSGPCSIEIIYPREWRIAIPASLMRVDKRQLLSIFYDFLLPFLKIWNGIPDKL